MSDVRLNLDMELYKALAKAQGEFPDITHDKTAGSGKWTYNYSSLANIRRTVQPALSANGLSLSQPIEILDGKHVLATYLYHESGGVLASHMVMGIENIKDPKDVGKIITYFRRYQMSSILNISSDEDSENAMDEPKGPTGQNKGGKPPAREKPPQAEIYAGTPAQVSRLVAILEKKGITDESVHSVIDGKLQGKEMTMEALKPIIEEVQNDLRGVGHRDSSERQSEGNDRENGHKAGEEPQGRGENSGQHSGQEGKGPS